ncbi:tRNA N6-adenosine threonylcarbamoyltransferase mitochondrial [Spathaspora sp. JA1]|nr:tRNA N6-adenosine threonylcarbamoyltransferase mitochondrial [Spathaspora sp. JA1]
MIHNTIFKGCPSPHRITTRFYKVLAIESSCDDSCVALLDKYHPDKPPLIIDQFKKTLNSADTGGIIPTAAINFHHTNIASLTQALCLKHNITSSNPPDLICVTRGPGMVGSLSSSIQFAKGLSVAWDVPLIGVHHMLGHLLTAQLPKTEQPDLKPPEYPFLSLLCSGGHTMLVHSKSLTEHEIILDVNGIAVGDSLDKCARELGMHGNMLGKELEKFVDTISPEEIEEFESMNMISRSNNEYNFKLTLPFVNGGINKEDNICFSFAQFLSAIQQYKGFYKGVGGGEELYDAKTKRMLAYMIQERIFDHMINRINVAFKQHGTGVRADGKLIGVKNFICSGGVASNQRLRRKLQSELKFDMLDVSDVTFHFPDLSLCTDNAIMIGNAGINIFEQLKLKSSLEIMPIIRWPLNELVSIGGWVEMNDEEYNKVIQ